MRSEKEPENLAILPVLRTKEDARRFYDRISRAYDLITRLFERKYAEIALNHLSVQEGEIVLEIGFGSGYCLKLIAESVGPTGKAYGVDISMGMLEVTKKRLEKSALMPRVHLYCGDATSLPYDDTTFDAVFMSFTLELFDTPEIPIILEEIKRVLKPKGRLAVASMSKENGQSILLRLYEWLHKKWPRYVDCRPIYLERSLKDAGYEVIGKERVKLFSLPGEIAVALKSS